MLSHDRAVSKVELTIPMRAEYVSVARLTVAGIANRVGFDFEAIEDIKVSLSEVCNRLISGGARVGSDEDGECRLEFLVFDDCLQIKVFADDVDGGSFINGTGGISEGGFGGAVSGVEAYKGADGGSGGLWLSLIHLLMDEFIVSPDGDCLVSMKKNLE